MALVEPAGQRQQVLPLVCRRWRDICRANPSIHTHVSLLARGRTAPAFVEEYLRLLLPYIEHFNMQAAFAKENGSAFPPEETEATSFRILQQAPRLCSLRMSNDGPHLAARALTCPPLAISGRTAALLSQCTALTSLLLQEIALPADPKHMKDLFAGLPLRQCTLGLTILSSTPSPAFRRAGYFILGARSSSFKCPSV